jgi:hypothetical protein
LDDVVGRLSVSLEKTMWLYDRLDGDDGRLAAAVVAAVVVSELDAFKALSHTFENQFLAGVRDWRRIEGLKGKLFVENGMKYSPNLTRRLFFSCLRASLGHSQKYTNR